jgi:hypothetical protein
MRSHYKAIEQRLAGLTLSGKTVPGALGDPADNVSPPYWFVTPRPSIVRSESVAGRRDMVDETFNVTFVHVTANNCLALQEAGAALLDEWAPQVDGWVCYPLEPVDALPVQTATAVVNGESNTYPPYAVVQYRLRAVKEQ